MDKLADAKQRAQALDPHNSFIIQAPAGSGKTELLTQRYLTLLSQVQHPEEILAITFTRKAAAEMRNRIIAALQSASCDLVETSGHGHALHTWQLAQKALQQNQRLHWQLLENPNRLRILTIDAFCASLTRHMPILSALGAPSAITEDAETLYTAAAQQLLSSLTEQAPWINALEKLLEHLDNDYTKTQQLLCAMLANRDQWLGYILPIANTQDWRMRLEQGLKRTNVETLSQLLTTIPHNLLEELYAIALFAAQQLQTVDPNAAIVKAQANFSSQLKTQAVSALQQMLTQQSLTKQDELLIEQTKQTWLALTELLLTEKNTWRKSADKRQGFPAPSSSKDKAQQNYYAQQKYRFTELIAALSELPDLNDILCDLRELPPLHYSTNQWEILVALLELLPILVAHLQLVFQERQQVDYIEIAQRALQALGSTHAPTDLALTLDYQLHHILVDEFQDTSLAQYRLLEQLTAGWEPQDGRTLFLVGDPMQSIYRFRKAEVGLFLQAQEKGLHHIRLTPLTLTVNFRAAAPLVEWVNTHFAHIMPAQANISHGAIPFTPSVARNGSDIQVEASGTYFHTLLEDSSIDETATIVKLIQETRTAHPNASIAILVRARTHVAELLPLLRAAHIAYRAVEIETLRAQPVIQQLEALTRALLHPADRIAWLAILRAPWCGLSLNDLLKIVNFDTNATLWDCLLHYHTLDLSEEGQQRLNRVFPVLLHSMQARRRHLLTTWIRGTWLALGGPACLQNKEDLENAELFFKLLNNFAQQDAYLDITTLQSKLDSLYAGAAAQQNNPVEIMTMHKAKGLEFDVVILPALNRAPAADTMQLLQCLERTTYYGEPDLLLAPIKSSTETQDAIYDYLRWETQKRARYETARLLYVALTRAKHTVHLVATLKSAEKSIEKLAPQANSLLDYLWPTAQQEFLNAIHQDSSAAKEIVLQSTIANAALSRLKADWKLPATPQGRAIEFSPLVDFSVNDNAVLAEFNAPLASAIGIVIHRLLQQISLQPLETWNEERIIAYQPVIRCLLLQEKVNPALLEESIAKVNRALSLTLKSEYGRWILNNSHQHAASEYALTGYVDKEIVQIIIDRTFVDANNIRWIIDYKSSECIGADVEAFLAGEVARYRQQLEFYARIMSQTETRPIRVAIYFPLLQAWREWQPEIMQLKVIAN